MRKIIALALVVGIGAVLTMGRPIVVQAAELPKIDSTASVGALNTTWRPGDTVGYTVACRDVEFAKYIAKDWSDEAWYKALRSGLCIDVGMFGFPPIEAVLVKWVSGPYSSMRDGSGPSDVSLWKVIDTAGETEYILLYDHDGPHGTVINWHI